MRLLCALVAPLLAAVALAAPPFPVPVNPPAPAPAPVGGATDLKANRVYVVDSATDGEILARPEGLVTVTKRKGPITVDATFWNSVSGASETRDFVGPAVFLVKPVSGKSGAVTLDFVPYGYKSAKEIATEPLNVNGGQGPQPPPKPDPDPKKVDKVFVVVVEDGPRTLETAKLLNDPYWQTLKPKHDYRHYLSTSQTAVNNGYVNELTKKDASGNAVGYPGVLILDAKDGAVLDKFKFTSVAQLDQVVKAVSK